MVQGRHLDLVLTAADVEVMIGDVECTVTSMSSSQLTCSPNVSASFHSRTADLFVRLTRPNSLLTDAIFRPHRTHSVHKMRAVATD